MTPRSRTGSAVRLLAGLAVLTALAFAGNLLTDSQQAFAGGSTPTPAGTIYYHSGNATGDSYYAIKADGSGKSSNLLPGVVGPGSAYPAFHPSGSNAAQDRWWIYTAQTDVYDNYIYANGTVAHNVPHWDLFAGRSNPQNRSQLVTVRLTDLYGVVRCTGGACWSNDSNEDANSFIVGVMGQDLRNAFVENPDGTTTINVAQEVHCSLRVPLTASEIQAGWQANDFVPISDISTTEEELDEMLWPYFAPYPYASTGGTIAPSGNFLLLNTYDYTKLQIADWSNPASGNPPHILWDGSTKAPNHMQGVQWSPDGTTIAIDELVTTFPRGGNIWTIPAAGGTPKMVLAASVKGSTITSYSGWGQAPIWSPDGKYLVVLKEQFTGTTLTGAWLTRLSLSDGKTLDLVPLSTTASWNVPLRWVADN